MDVEVLNIPPIELRWSDWTKWDAIKAKATGGFGVQIPKKAPGVYEVKYVDAEQRLTIGKTSDLRGRIRDGLVKGNIPHSTGVQIRTSEDAKRLVVRWAVTDRPSAAEEELHKQYLKRFGAWPKYTQHT